MEKKKEQSEKKDDGVKNKPWTFNMLRVAVDVMSCFTIVLIRILLVGHVSMYPSLTDSSPH